MNKRILLGVAACGVLAISHFAAALAAEGGSGRRVISFFMQMPSDALSLTHGNKDGGISPFPEGIKSLAGTDIDHTLALTTRLRDETGKLIGLTSELEDFPATFDAEGELVWDTYWTVMIAGRGSLLLYEKESLGAEVGKIFYETPRGDVDWQGSLTRSSTVGPLPGGFGVIVGGTGEFEGATGRFQEIGTLKRFTVKGEIEADIELRIWLDGGHKGGKTR